MATRVVAIALLGASGLMAGLPEMEKQPWMGHWIANEQRQFDYAVASGTGRGWLYPKVRRREGNVHAGDNDRFQFVFILEEMTRGKWTRRMVDPAAFETEQAAGTDAGECEFIATYEGGSKARIRHRFERGEIRISTELVHKASADPTRVGVLILTPKVHAVLDRETVPGPDEIERIMRQDEIRAVRLDGKRFKFELHEEVKLDDPELLRDGAEEFSLEVKRYGGRPIVFSSADEGGGRILFRQPKSLFEPYRVSWYPTEDRTPPQGAELVVKFK